jgi:hypothetical protein
VSGHLFDIDIESATLLGSLEVPLMMLAAAGRLKSKLVLLLPAKEVPSCSPVALGTMPVAVVLLWCYVLIITGMSSSSSFSGSIVLSVEAGF